MIPKNLSVNNFQQLKQLMLSKKSEAWGRLGFCIAGNRIALLIDKGLEHRSALPPHRNTVLGLVAAGGVGMDVTTCA